MAKPHLYIKDKNTKGETPIILYYRKSGQLYRYYTGISVKPVFWSIKREHILQRHSNNAVLNERLQRLLVAAEEAYFQVLNTKGQVSKADFKIALDELMGKTISTDTPFTFFDAYIEKKVNSPQYNPDSFKSYRTARNKLSDYCTAEGIDLQFRDIDHHFYTAFETHLLQQNYSSNYINKLLTRIMTMLKAAAKEPFGKDLQLDKLEVTVMPEDATSIYLTEEEVNKLYAIDYSGNKRLEKARDIFIAGCVTGLRYGDFVRIESKNIRTIEGYEFLDFLNKKTGHRVVIPVDPILPGLLEKYDGKIPRISDQKLRDYIKEIGQSCGFLDDLINDVRTVGGKTRSNMVPRWTLLGTHTARRSFATNSFLKGWPVISIMKITGHKTERQFMKYIRIDAEQNALHIARSFIKKS
ncbi:MAG: phage integrase SAM-like domain-containing protein [Bacteroidota bacterium]